MIHIFIYATIQQKQLQHPWNELINAYIQNPDSEACNELSLFAINFWTPRSTSEISDQLKNSTFRFQSQERRDMYATERLR